ncbi:MAG: tetratricopeptide repeat protein [Bdellovibrionales bacterium]|nr:tetratricopeptide repeat protein [Bdellovibrionales bacterium]
MASRSLASAPAPSPVPSETAEMKEFLALPSKDLEVIGMVGQDGLSIVNLPIGDQMLKPGDTVVLRLSGFEPDTAAGWTYDVPKGMPAILDAGFVVESYIPGQGEPSRAKGKDLFVSATVTRPGRLTLPSFQARDPSGKAQIRTNPWSIDVGTVFKSQEEAQKAELAPPRPPVGLPLPTFILASGLVVFGLVALVLSRFLLKVYRKYRDRPKMVLPDVPLPEDTVALKKLEQLRAEGLAKAGKHKAHYFRTSEIMKEYLSSRYEFDARESTSQEILRALEAQNRVPEEKMAELERLFERLDVIKFTDQIPGPTDPDRIIQDAVQWVTTTKRPTTIITPGGIQPAKPLAVMIALAAGLTWTAPAKASQPTVGAYLENEKGLDAFKKGKPEEAIRHFGAAQAHDPRDPSLQFNQGSVQMEAGDTEAAISALKGATEEAKRGRSFGMEGWASYNLGSAYAKKQQNAEAIAAWTKAIQAARRSGDQRLELDARKNIEILSKKQQNQSQDQKNQENKDKKDQNQDQQQQQQAKNNQNGDPKDQKKDEKDPKGDQGKDQQAKNYQDPSKGRQKEFKSQKLNKEDAERVMAELSSREKELQGKLNKQKGGMQANEKDW